MSGLCKYKHIFGKEGEGAHSIRVFNIAIVDVGLTILGAVILARMMGWNAMMTIVGAFIAGIIAHRLFCVNSTVNKAIFGEV